MSVTNTLLVAELPREETFADAVLAGLSRPAKAIPCKYLYDAKGSTLFDAICELPEYYPTRTEHTILRRHASEIAKLAGSGCTLIEFGSGSSTKTRLLLDALHTLQAYMPVDISREHLQAACAALAADYPTLDILGVCADYMQPLDLDHAIGTSGRRIGFFPGSTIGNLVPDEARLFLQRAVAVLGGNGALVIGVDLKKDAARLHAAYNDSAGITAAFNLNLLQRMNRELGASFVLARFEHEAFYNADAGRIEIYIRSLTRQRVCVAGHWFEFASGERIHTEYSYKYAVPEFVDLARSAGFATEQVWTDERDQFGVCYLRPEMERSVGARVVTLRREV